MKMRKYFSRGEKFGVFRAFIYRNDEIIQEKYDNIGER